MHEVLLITLMINNVKFLAAERRDLCWMQVEMILHVNFTIVIPGSNLERERKRQVSLTAR